MDIHTEIGVFDNEWLSEESYRAFLLSTQFFAIIRFEDQEEARISKQGSSSADTAILYHKFLP